MRKQRNLHSCEYSQEKTLTVAILLVIKIEKIKRVIILNACKSPGKWRHMYCCKVAIFGKTN